VERKIILLIVIGLLLIIQGCYETSLELNFNEEGFTPVKIRIEGGTYAGSDDISFTYWQIKSAIPEVSKNYWTTKERRTIVLERKEPINVQDLDWVELTEKNGVFEFIGTFPKIIDSPSDSDDIFLILTVTLPKEIDMANTTNVDGNKAVWVLRKRDVHRAQTLRAFTVSD